MPRKRIKEETLYRYDELSDKAKQKALEGLWDLNVDDGVWFEWIEEDIERFGEVSGLGCTYGHEFSLDRRFYIHIENLNCRFSELQENFDKALSGYPDVTKKVVQPFLDAFSPRKKRYINLLEKMDVLRGLTGETSTDQRSIRYEIDTDVWGNYKRLNGLIDELEDNWRDLIQTLEHYYINALRLEYEYQTGREQVEESIRVNEYEFLEDGTMV